MHKAPRIIILIMILMLVGWGGFWLVASRGTERVLTGWFEDRRAEGWTASYDSLNTGGFPNRLDTTIEGVVLADPDTGISWQAPVFQNLSLVYRPTEVIAVFPGEQVFAARDETYRVESETFRASAALGPQFELPILRSTVEIGAATVTTSDGRVTGLDTALISMRETPDREGDVYDLDVNVAGLRPDPAFMERLNASGAFSDALETVRVAGTIRFDAPWDRYALERARPQPREIELTRLDAKWGELTLAASGTLTVGAAGRPEGEIQVRAENWRAMIDLAYASGALPESLVGAVTRAGTMIAGLSGDPDTLDATLRFENGRAFLGPVPIGQAPDLSLP
ncbi:DUF2125 domain-containing protein [Maritimibacter dapengensis]|uniref:DUF2125 domain-containing protein n=1 Tax=Maritimibacter dapengensis TaxID=2836868 RepID=A0ABS6SZC6_9RHOB|nr:DUF2125 domain-containing protein [Maritimibacter dapengensis]MBV7377651.1 DUF2125 domain-containing protein [Maritimibacter dapengensis]